MAGADDRSKPLLGEEDLEQRLPVGGDGVVGVARHVSVIEVVGARFSASIWASCAGDSVDRRTSICAMRSTLARSRRVGGEERSDARHRGIDEEGAQVDGHAEEAIEAGQQAGGLERVATELEEVVQGADPLGLEERGEDAGHDPLDVGAGLDVLGARGLACTIRGREGLAVDLPVGGEGELVEHDEARRDHVVRDLALDDGPKLGDAQRVGRVGRDDVGDEPSRRRLPVGDDDRLADRRVAAERGFDLAELDAVASDLDLVVQPAQELQGPVGPPADQVTGAVQPPLDR